MSQESCPTSCKAFRPGEMCAPQIKAKMIALSTPPLEKQKIVPGQSDSDGATVEGLRTLKDLARLHAKAEKLGCPSAQRATRLSPDFAGKKPL